MDQDPIPIVVDNRVRMPLARLAEGDAEQIRDLFTHRNPNPDDGPAFYRTWKHDGDDITVPRGGMSRLRTLLRDRDVPFTVTDRRTLGDRSYLDNDWGGRPIPHHTVELWAWQKAARVDILLKQNCILRAPTGSGKSTAGISLFADMGVPTLVVVPTGGLVEQWTERFVREMGISPKDIGIIGQGKHKTAPATVATQSALAEGIRPDWLKAFGAVIFDEVHRAAAPTIFAAVDPWPAKFRIGMSADHTRHDKKEFLIMDLFGSVAASISQEDVIKAGQVVDVEIRMIPTELEAEWYRNAVMSGNNFHIRAAHRKLLEVMWNNEARNLLISRTVRREVKDGHQIMVLSLRREHCLQLDQTFTKMGIKSGVMLGGTEAKSQFRATKEGIRDGSLRVVTGTIDAIGTGQDFPTITSGLIAMPIYNNRQLVNQVKGRFARACRDIGKTKGILYCIVDFKIQGKRPLENMLKWNNHVSVFDGESWISGNDYLARLGGAGSRTRPNFSDDGPVTIDEL